MKRYFFRPRTLTGRFVFVAYFDFISYVHFGGCLLVGRKGLKVTVDYLTSALSEELSSPPNPSPWVLLISMPGRVRAPNFSWNIILQDPPCRNNSSKQVLLGLGNVQPVLNEILKQELTGVLWQGWMHIPGIAVGGGFGALDPWQQCHDVALATLSTAGSGCTLCLGCLTPHSSSQETCQASRLRWNSEYIELWAVSNTSDAAAARTNDWKGKLCLKFRVYED